MNQSDHKNTYSGINLQSSFVYKFTSKLTCLYGLNELGTWDQERTSTDKNMPFDFSEEKMQVEKAETFPSKFEAAL